MKFYPFDDFVIWRNKFVRNFGCKIRKISLVYRKRL